MAAVRMYQHFPDGTYVVQNDSYIKGVSLMIHGDRNFIDAPHSTVCGNGNIIQGTSVDVTGNNNNVYSMLAKVRGDCNRVEGSCAEVTGNQNSVNDNDYSRVHGDSNTVGGYLVRVEGDENLVSGSQVSVRGNENNVTGDRTSVRGDNNVVFGERCLASGSNNVVTGESSYTIGEQNTSVNSVLVGGEVVQRTLQLLQQTERCQQRARQHERQRLQRCEALYHRRRIDQQNAVTHPKEQPIQLTLRGQDEEYEDSGDQNGGDAQQCLICRENKAIVLSCCCWMRTTCIKCTRDLYNGKMVGQEVCMLCREVVENVGRVL